MAALAFEKSLGKWIEAEKELFNECMAYIKSQLELMPNNEIYIDYGNISSTPSVICRNDDDYVASDVENVYLDNKGGVYVDTEDFYGYPARCLTAKELSIIAVAVKETIEANFDVEE